MSKVEKNKKKKKDKDINNDKDKNNEEVKKFEDNKLILSNEIKFEVEKGNKVNNNNDNNINNNNNNNNNDLPNDINSLLSQINFEMNSLSEQIKFQFELKNQPKEKEETMNKEPETPLNNLSPENNNNTIKFQETGIQYENIDEEKLNNISKISSKRKSKSEIQIKDESIQIDLKIPYEANKYNDYFSSLHNSQQSNNNNNMNPNNFNKMNPNNINNINPNIMNHISHDENNNNFPPESQYGIIKAYNNFNKFKNASRVKKMDELYNVKFLNKYPKVYKQPPSFNYNNKTFREQLNDINNKYSNNLDYQNLTRHRNGGINQATNILLD